MRNLQGSTDTALDQSMGRKAARLARKPHVVGSIALDQRLRGGGGGEPVFAEPTIIIGGVGTASATITFDMPPGTVCHDGEINLSRMAVNGFNRDIDSRNEPISNPDFWIGWFSGQDGQPSVAGLTAVELAALWHYDGTLPHTGSGTEVTCRAVGNVVTITEVDGKIISFLQVDWTKAAPAALVDPVTDPASFPWDTMTTHAQIDGWADANGVARGADWAQMTLASKRQWLVAYFDGATPWINGN